MIRCSLQTMETAPLQRARLACIINDHVASTMSSTQLLAYSLSWLSANKNAATCRWIPPITFSPAGSFRLLGGKRNSVMDFKIQNNSDVEKSDYNVTADEKKVAVDVPSPSENERPQQTTLEVFVLPPTSHVLHVLIPNHCSGLSTFLLF
jgi:hypothetical protein